MKDINNYTEQEVISIIDGISKRLAPKYVFGIYDREDIEQEAFIIGIDALNLYDNDSPQAPLSAFLYTFIRCKLKNFKRDNSVRSSSNCNNCKTFDPECPSCIKRENNERAKYNLSYPLDIDKVEKACVEQSENINIDELLSLVNQKLPVEMREDYLKIKENVYVPKKRKEQIEHKVLEIVGVLD